MVKETNQVDCTKIKVYAFVGPSGTGKSYRAQMVAAENGIEYIIDDGLLIKGNDIVAGTSAKKAATKIETVKHALFLEEKEREEIRKAFEKENLESILILGTSDGMVEKIAENLGLPKIQKTIYIQDVATETEIEQAKRMRTVEGKHVIPVPTFELKKEFSGYLLDPLQIFKSKGKGKDPYITEKSIIRPTFSYLGNFTISENVFKTILEYVASKNEYIYRVAKIRVDKSDRGLELYMEVIVVYGCNVYSVLKEFREKCKKEVEKLTTMVPDQMAIVAKGIHIPEAKKEQEF